MPLHIDDLLRYAVTVGASDLHLTASHARGHPAARRHPPHRGCPALDNETIRDMVFGILPGLQSGTLRSRDTNSTPRTRSPAWGGSGSTCPCSGEPSPPRCGPSRTRSRSSTPSGIPESIRPFTELRRGLVLVTGPTGSGKSTTLASLVDIINRTKPLHIVTVEDPIEFLHNHKRSIVNQREVGEDTKSFSEALRRVLRQDPDVILVGELRDLETISTALTAAETGHLVFATLHTQDAPQTIDRIIDVFPTNQQEQIRIMLAASLEGVVTQQLILNGRRHRAGAVFEVLVCTSAIRNLIRSEDPPDLLADAGGSTFGMQTMDQGLAKLVQDGRHHRSRRLRPVPQRGRPPQPPQYLMQFIHMCDRRSGEPWH